MGKWPILDRLEMNEHPVDEETYERKLKKLQNRLLDLQVHHMRTGGRVIIGIDGWDAAGKGGAIQRLIFGLEPRSTHVWRIGAPTPTEQGRHYLWRFWERLPAPGNWSIFDRTWYGRVLVERIEGLCDPAAWKRAYREINEFERQLTDDGVRIVKLLFHVSEEEQKHRMIERLDKPHKRHKLGVEDFRNIAKRKQYLEAYKDMLDKTDTDYAPWHVIASDNKRQARLACLAIVADAIGQGVKITENTLDPRIAEAAYKLWGWKPADKRKARDRK
ncbi:Polyphosphate kinase 2, PPK2 family [Enhydrobacter aerosaccus]|uniref:Polyphosphate kinase 2, PPK2 family n=1 Tax=Enhydrobacter aerosaccus TaxID=225324 RepID=A0A1T4RGW9_9HYPH|nr:polyphosphate kinase [Enhydrobacter aerosaccus]SKA15280.1 Polyphosphate kinase 2, PPK2 family [Enhydrobacter aerosaccus]